MEKTLIKYNAETLNIIEVQSGPSHFLMGVAPVEQLAIVKISEDLRPLAGMIFVAPDSYRTRTEEEFAAIDEEAEKLKVDPIQKEIVDTFDAKFSLKDLAAADAELEQLFGGKAPTTLAIIRHFVSTLES